MDLCDYAEPFHFRAGYIAARVPNFTDSPYLTRLRHYQFG